MRCDNWSLQLVIGAATWLAIGCSEGGGEPAAGSGNDVPGLPPVATAGVPAAGASGGVAGAPLGGGMPVAGATAAGGDATAGTAAVPAAGASGGGEAGMATAGTTGGTPAAGMEASGGSTAVPVPPDVPLAERLHVSEVSLDEGVDDGGSTWAVWGRDDLPVARVFTAPLSDCGTLVCTTTTSGGSVTPRVVRLDAADQEVAELTLTAGLHCRGIAVEPDGHFAALLWDSAGDRIYLERYDLAGNPGWSTELVNDDNAPDSFSLGESRVDYGDGRYGAYYHVHSDSGHEGDTLKWVDAASGSEDTRWSWGCSHSMSNVLRYHPALNEFMPACVTDCYPGTSGSNFATAAIGGVYINNRQKVLDVDGGCNGNVAGELGSAALSPDGWKLVFNAHQAPATLGTSSYDAGSMNQDIGFAGVGSGFAPGAVVWITDTPGVDERDSSIARWEPDGESAEQYLLGWAEPGGAGRYLLSRVDASGGFLEAPVDVSATARWGRRDDPFRRHVDADVVWAWFDSAGSTTMRFARVDAGVTDAACTPLPAP